jgi:hypothetical protein
MTAHSVNIAGARGKTGFVDFSAAVFDASWKEPMTPQGLPSGSVYR